MKEIRIQALSKAYGGKQVLKGLNLTIPGEKTTAQNFSIKTDDELFSTPFTLTDFFPPLKLRVAFCSLP